MLSLIPFNRRESNLFHYMDDLEKNFFNTSISGSTQFRCDIFEKDGNYVLEAELPGFSKENINIGLDGDMLTITASHSEEVENKEGNYVRRERRFGTFSRSFDVTGIDTETITASYDDGVLRLTLPKAKEPEQPETRKIEIK